MESDDIKLVKCSSCKGTGKDPMVLDSYAVCIRCGGVGLVAEVIENGMVYQQPITSPPIRYTVR